jgi:hypothetical protein
VVKIIDTKVDAPWGRQPALDILKHQGRTMRWISDRTGIAYHTVRRELKGETAPSLRLRDFLMRELRLPEEKLFTRDAIELGFFAQRLKLDQGARP